MAKQYPQLQEKHKQFIQEQHVFFVGSADREGRVNVSPKGMDAFRVIDNNRVVWLNLTGSGNETAAHLLVENRITIMFCSFTEKPLILRLYGKGEVIQSDHEHWQDLISLFPVMAGTRQIIDVQLDLVQTSCGFAVPFYEYKGERELLLQWAEKRGDEGIKEYWASNNQLSIDGKSTGM